MKLPITHLRGGRIVGVDGAVTAGDVLAADGLIRSIVHGGAGPGDVEQVVSAATSGDVSVQTIDVDGMLIAPGLIDLQNNGGWGHDFTREPTSIIDVARRLPETGVTSFVPTVISCPIDHRSAAIEAMTAYSAEPGAADALGLHFEGPALDPSRKGAHPAEHVGPVDLFEVEEWIASGVVKIVTMAPETQGSATLARTLSQAGIIVSVGHSDTDVAGYQELRRNGATLVTHLYNAMSGLSARQPGLIGAVLADETVYASIICDRLHVADTSIRVARRCLGPDRLVLVTDATVATGIERFKGELGHQPIEAEGGAVRTPHGVLAGSNLTMDRAVRTFRQATGCSQAEALLAASARPAKILGCSDRGEIRVGSRADLVVVDDELNVHYTFTMGALAWKSS